MILSCVFIVEEQSDMYNIRYIYTREQKAVDACILKHHIQYDEPRCFKYLNEIEKKEQIDKTGNSIMISLGRIKE